MNEWPVLALIFTVTAIVAFFLMSALTLAGRDENPGDEPAPRVFGGFTPLVAGFLPQSVDGRNSLRKALLRAGYFEPVAPVNFQAMRSVMTYVPLFVGEVGAGTAVLRSGARADDILYVSGRLGEAELGLRIMRQSKGPASKKNNRTGSPSTVS